MSDQPADVTAEELAAVQRVEQLDERLQPYFAPDYDSVADDTSYAESPPQV